MDGQSKAESHIVSSTSPFTFTELCGVASLVVVDSKVYPLLAGHMVWEYVNVLILRYYLVTKRWQLLLQ